MKSFESFRMFAVQLFDFAVIKMFYRSFVFVLLFQILARRMHQDTDTKAPSTSFR
jgi:hypothetical protein